MFSVFAARTLLTHGRLTRWTVKLHHLGNRKEIQLKTGIKESYTVVYTQTTVEVKTRKQEKLVI